MNNKKYLIKLGALFILVSISASLPVLYVIYSAGQYWQGVVPPYVTDAIFYMPKLVKGTQAFPFGNNPFFIEHVNDINATPSVADYIGSVPLKLGFTMPVALIINAVFWNIAFIYLSYRLLQVLGIKNNWALILTLPLYASLYGMLVKPVVLQIVMPFFILFLLSLMSWLRRPDKPASIKLALSLAGTLYVYPYTFQIACATIGVVTLSYLAERNWQRVFLLMKIGLGVLAFSLPVLWYIYREISHPLFVDMIIRSGSIETRLPSAVSFYVGRWIITGIGMGYLILFLWPDLKKDDEFKTALYLIKALGLGILIVLMSPILSGRDAMIGHHVGREVFFWLSLFVIYISWFIFQKRAIIGLSWRKYIILALLIINIMPLFQQYRRSVLQPFQSDKDGTIRAQAYAGPLSWLDKYDSQSKVIWANSDISIYIPFVSNHYVLTPGAFLAHQYFVEISEIQERYLLARYFEDIDSEFIEKEYEMPLGANYTQELAHAQFKSYLCVILFNILCDDSNISEIVERHEKEVQALVLMNKKEIRPRIYDLIKKYNVSYAVKDVKEDKDFYFEKLDNTQEIYNDGRFVIYEFKR